MATTEISYGTIEQSITITLNSLADGGLRESTAVSNTINKFIEVLISGVCEAASGVTDGTLNIYAYGRTGSGRYSGAATGTDAAYGSTAGQNKANLAFLGSVTIDAATTEEFEWGPFPLSPAFGCVPDEWGVVVEWLDNGGTAALHSADNVVTYQGIKYTSA